MTEITALKPKITNAGLSAVFNSSQTGFEAMISHVAFGDGAGQSYNPTGGETRLKNELARAPIGGGERVTDNQIIIQGVLDQGPEFWMREVGFFLNDGTLLAVWSERDHAAGKDLLMTYFKQGVPFVYAFALVLSGVPKNSVNVQITGPAVNVVFDREHHQIIANQASIMRLQWRQQEAFYHKFGHYPGEQP